MRLPIADIRLDPDLQLRAAIDSTLASSYADAMSQGATFPPIVVFHDGAVYWLADGWHRVYAARELHRDVMDVEVRAGGKHEALVFAAGANIHGQMRSHSYVRNAIDALLNDARVIDEDWPNSRVAKIVGCHATTVAARREAVIVNTSNLEALTIMDDEPWPDPPAEDDPMPDEPLPPVPPQDTWTLPQWNSLSAEQRRAVIEIGRQSTHKIFNRQTTDNIEWARWSWNPITGCKHTCVYCYARDIANRFYEHGFEPAIVPERLAIPRSMRLPKEAAHDIGYRNVFAGSMADVFGRWVPQAWIDAVFAAVSEAPQWNFLMLTKFPKRMAEQAWPANVWAGTSVDSQARVKAAEDAFEGVTAGVKWLSCEPLLEPLKFTRLKLFDWIVIGGQSAASQVETFYPNVEWVLDLTAQARKAGCKVYYKSNLIHRLREYPGAKP